VGYEPKLNPILWFFFNFFNFKMHHMILSHFMSIWQTKDYIVDCCVYER
jgi:hypothetical protein